MILPRAIAAIIVAVFAVTSFATDFAEVNPTVFGPDDPRTKDLPKMMGADAKRRMQEANLRESKAFAEVTTKEQWEKYRDARIAKLRESLGTFPEASKVGFIGSHGNDDVRGDGFIIRKVMYESRPRWWVTANLFLPAKRPAKMPGIIISHSHHNGKTDGELQDMGMTWARSGAAVLIPDHLGYGERRQHDFNTAKDYDKPFRAGRQDYFFRYNENLQLSAVGDSLMGWMVWDLMRGLDALLDLDGIDKKRIILLGAVAGGGDPAGVTAALDSRIACVVPFNFGGWQPESSVLENSDRDFAWFGDGYWESTRGLRSGASGGFAHFDIVGNVAPRKVIYAHEFAWDEKTDPAWPRLQKIFGFYDAKDSLRVAHGAGTVRASGAGNTHCNHIGAVHRKMIYPALKEWFGMPIPEEYSKRRPAEDLICWTEAAKTGAKPLLLHQMVGPAGAARRKSFFATLPEDEKRHRDWGRDQWSSLLGSVEPILRPEITEGKSEAVPGGTLARFAVETNPGITVPVFVITPKDAKGKLPSVVMVASAGKAAFLKERGDAIAAFLKADVAVCLVDVRGTGETRPGSSADRGSSRTSISQTNLILGQPVLGAQMRDLRTVIRWLSARDGIDSAKIAVWGDSFAKVNPKFSKVAVPLDIDDLAISEPGGANLACLAGLFEDRVVAVYARGGLDQYEIFAAGPYFHVPHDAIVPGPVQPSAFVPLVSKLTSVKYEGTINTWNQPTERNLEPANAAEWVIGKLRTK